MTLEASEPAVVARPAPQSARRARLRGVLAALMVGMGVLHFVVPGPFVRIVPAWLPAPLLLVQVSGFFEMAGGVGLLVSRVRRWASYGLVLLYLAVFPANINMALHPGGGASFGIPAWLLWARLPLQVVFIAWALWVGRDRAAPPSPTARR